MKKFGALISLLLLFLGCSWRQNPSVDGVAGSYIGQYKNARESIQLRNDLRFVQELRINDVVAYHNEGNWRIMGKYIIFDNFYCAIEPGTDNLSIPKIGMDNVEGQWVVYGGRSEIVFDVDHDYRITKQ
jgi:hypothetical protein